MNKRTKLLIIGVGLLALLGGGLYFQPTLAENKRKMLKKAQEDRKHKQLVKEVLGYQVCGKCFTHNHPNATVCKACTKDLN